MEKITLSDFLKIEKINLRGKVICFPTDTVYGVGAMYDDSNAIDKIYVMKNRSKDKPLVNLCSSVEQIEKLSIEIKPKVRELMEKHWPGALTIILKDNDHTISFRMPDSEIALSIINKFYIIATTSVNESGEVELNSYDAINEQFKDHIDYFITDVNEFSKVPSTIIDASKDEMVILRKGKINLDNLE